MPPAMRLNLEVLSGEGHWGLSHWHGPLQHIAKWNRLGEGGRFEGAGEKPWRGLEHGAEGHWLKIRNEQGSLKAQGTLTHFPCCQHQPWRGVNCPLPDTVSGNLPRPHICQCPLWRRNQKGAGSGQVNSSLTPLCCHHKHLGCPPPSEPSGPGPSAGTVGPLSDWMLNSSLGSANRLSKIPGLSIEAGRAALPFPG
jgi:hypothetical protein